MNRYERMAYEAIEMGKFILEGHDYAETAEEFGVSHFTLTRRMKILEEICPKMYLEIVAQNQNRARKS